MATTTRSAPSGTARVPGRNGNGVASWIAAPETSEIKYTNGGRTRPRFATSCAVPGELEFCGLVIMVFGQRANVHNRKPGAFVRRHKAEALVQGPALI